MALLAIFVFVVVVAAPASREELLTEAGKAAFQAGIVGLLVAGAKFALDEYQAERESRTAKHRALLVALNSLTESHWEIKKALLVVDAHGSAKSYGEQMRLMVDHRLSLQRLHNEVDAGLYDLGAAAKTVSASLGEIDQPLDELTHEWKAEYLRLSGLQSEDMEISDTEKKRVPAAIAALPVLRKVRADDFAAIHEPFERAAEPFRQRLSPGPKPAR
jgi:hypothetical protein